MTGGTSGGSFPGGPGTGAAPAHGDYDPGPAAREVLASVGEAAREVSQFASHLMREQPGAALVAAAVAGFVAGGGLLSPLGMRVATGTFRAAAGNLSGLVALDLVRRAMGGESVGAPARDASA
jgi:hypothetical protein